MFQNVFTFTKVFFVVVYRRNTHNHTVLIEEQFGTAPYNRPYCGSYKSWYRLKASSAPKFSSHLFAPFVGGVSETDIVKTSPAYWC